MSYPLFLPPKGLGWNFKVTQKFTNTKQVPQSGRGPVGATLQRGVIYEFELVWNYLKVNQVNADNSLSNSFAYLKNFYEAMGGSLGRFLFDPSLSSLKSMYVSPDFTQIENGFCGIGDGVTTAFPMWRSTSVLGAGNVTQLEQIQNVSRMDGVYIDGAKQPASLYSQTNFPAVLTFATPPAANAPVTWGGKYSYLVSFAEDTNDLNEFMSDLWELKSLRLESINL